MFNPTINFAAIAALTLVCLIAGTYLYAQKRKEPVRRTARWNHTAENSSLQISSVGIGGYAAGFRKHALLPWVEKSRLSASCENPADETVVEKSVFYDNPNTADRHIGGKSQ
jgi:hypothetical protein